MKKPFVHLHLHTEYSLLDGSCRISQLPERVKELGMDSVAITDHGNMSGAIAFYKQCKEVGIKPIMGAEVYVSEDSYLMRDQRKKRYHLILLAENNEGYKNLMKIVSEGYVNGYYYRPRVDYSVLEKYSKGIIATSACLAGEVQRKLGAGDFTGARETALKYKDIFGKDNFFLELQNHGMREQVEVNRELEILSKELDIPLIVSNDVHYLNKEDAKVHDVLLCIQTGTVINQEDRMKFPSDEFYLKSPEEMYEIFSDNLEALENTQKIADRCNVDIEFHKLHLPEFKAPEKYTSNDDYLKDLVLEGLKYRYKELTKEILDRFEYEYKTIVDMGYTDYFLIVWDFIKFAKDNDIMVGPGRGSAAGSIISYALGIIDVDPLEFGLLFERFLNPERVSMPDIDIDFCYERREEVIAYVVEKYGADRVAQIVTFGTMAARAAIRDVGRALDMPYGKVDYIAKLVPNELNMTIERGLSVSESLLKEYESDESTKELIDYALKLEGLPRHKSTHAAGVLISKEPITEFVPLTRNKDTLATQFNMIELEELGLLKMDFLGLRTLTVIRDTLNSIKEIYGKDINLEEIPYDDPKVLEMFAKAETLGIFQFESPGMRAFLKELKANKLEDLVAANSLFRPGPMDQIPKFVESKHDESKISYLHPQLESILNLTYGCIVYQEQVMEIVRKIGGYSFGRADLVRRAMSKKKMNVMEQERQNFIHGQLDDNGNVLLEGAIKRGVDEKSANKIYDLMIDFANYAFNKSHSVAYTIVAYRTAWLKTYYPVEFMAAQITSFMGNTIQTSLYIEECKRLGIEILKPDVNYSKGSFTVEKDKIRFGLKAVKNVGHNLINSILIARKDGEFKSFKDFIQRVDKTGLGAINKRGIESLIKAGAFDSLGGYRSQYMAVYERIIDSTLNESKRNLEGQFSLFEIGDKREKGDDLPELKELNKKTILELEKEMLGIYVSGHPLDPYKTQINRCSTMSTGEIYDLYHSDMSHEVESRKIKIGGIVSSKKTMITKNNKMMAFATLEDLVGSIELIIFPNIYTSCQNYLSEDSLICIEGNLSSSDVEEPKIIVEKISPLMEENYEKVYMKIKTLKDSEIVNRIKDILLKYKGNTPVIFYSQEEDKAFGTEKKYWINKDKFQEVKRELSTFVEDDRFIVMK